MQRLLLVDDHALFREGLARLLDMQDDFVVVGEAGDAESAYALATELFPDLVLMDIELPGEDGVSATRRLRAALPSVSVVMVTASDEGDRLLEALKAGACGYLVKNMRSEELLEQLRGLERGEAALSRSMATRLLDEFRKSSDGAAPEESALTFREIEVLTQVAARRSNKEIANILCISEHTVKNHLKNILAKLHLRNRRQAAAYGLARGWVRSDRDASSLS